MQIFLNPLEISDTTDSSSVTTGALQVEGGAGISRSLYVGNRGIFGYSLGLTQPYATTYVNTDTSTVNIVSKTNNGGTTLATAEPVLNLVRNGVSNQSWSNFATFYLSRYENVGINARTQLDISLSHDGLTANQDVNIKVLRLRSDGSIYIPSATDSTSTTSGAFQVAGGAGIAKNLHVGNNTSTQPSVLNIFGGHDGNLTGATAPSVMSFEYRLGGYKHFIRSRHHNVANHAQNAIEFFLNTGTTNAVSTVPGTGNIHAMSITAAGILAPIGMTVNGSMTISDATDSSSATSGALQVAGGIGIAKSAFINNSLWVGNGTTTANLIGLRSGTNVGTNAFYLAHVGVTIEQLKAGIFSTAVGTWGKANLHFAVNTALDATNVTPAQAQITIDGNTGAVLLPSTTDSSSTTSGALQVTGGVGVGGNVYATNMFIGTNPVATQAYVTGLGYLTSSTAASTYQPTITAGTGLTKSANTLSVNAAQTGITSLGSLTGLTSSGNVAITSANDSSSATSGALQVAGGAGIGKALYVGTDVNIGGT